MDQQRAHEPEDITRLLVERIKAGDAEGVAALYEPDSVLAFPPGRTTVGREAIRAGSRRWPADERGIRSRA